MIAFATSPLAEGEIVSPLAGRPYDLRHAAVGLYGTR
jgi:hypothetical protein